MISKIKHPDINENMHFKSNATSWPELAQDIIFGIDKLEALNAKNSLIIFSKFILVSVSTSCRSIVLSWCDKNGTPAQLAHCKICIQLTPLASDCGKQREDGLKLPNSTIDRAINRAAKSFISWTIDTYTLELLEHRRYMLMISWTQNSVIEASPWVYGMWD
jgi:hypothetical protein